MPIRIHDIVGTWDTVIDDWRGVLVLRPSDQELNEIDGGCTYTSYTLDGAYTGGDGRGVAVRGYAGGHDLNSRVGSCRQSDHYLSFTIAFPGDPPQPFNGYIFTHQWRTMAGYTWWHGTPFGWYARKRP